MQFTLFLSTLLSIVGFAMATPPACIINAIGVQGPDATDFDALCDTKQDYVLGNMTESCSSSAVSDAYDYYSSVCLEEASITVAALPTETSGSSSSDNNDDSDSSDSDSSSSSSESDEDDSSSGSTGDKESAAIAATTVVAAGTISSVMFAAGMTSFFYLL
ncbi:hypothetical protein MKZ38_007635 [Zalerion maritima]|uniref:Uncharacterized protein n=1 Tax=Zalerion maritima TaxID=339359 RepID=A0AAD5S046_9PEZI|nr:hypothetical protein MKZ38_007635 [Zalerion maritima]